MPLAAAKRLLSRNKRYPASGALARDGKKGVESLRFSWVWTTATHPDANLGDALSAVIVAAICQLPISRAAFSADSERLAAVGTIGHALHFGKVHLWGTGFDMGRDKTGALTGYSIPDDTEMVVHAVRGRRTAAALRQRGLDVGENYGDPVWFLPKVFPARVEKKWDLGVIVHISELDRPTADSLVRATIERYRIPPELADRVHIINTYTPATIDGLRDKVEEIAACRRILSTSLHGLVIAETYGIPCAWFATYAGPSGPLAIEGELSIDHRMKDFYSGVDRDYVLSYLQPLAQPTDWDGAIRFIDDNWRSLSYTGESLFRAFPLQKKVRFEDAVWIIPEQVLSKIPL
ncbi:polysaccharide pyruvyl transferase [Neorhizobium alkalisoli]|uniref:Polysaccharide pyruvyl transferase n=2 Tax=Neorhizobium alkalisoli TaxID=528178 RepID=A0A561R3H5_9HYPH|nr:polysaccharide pyruvyl transferase [Neorhizobium alkalisoli]